MAISVQKQYINLPTLTYETTIDFKSTSVANHKPIYPGETTPARLPLATQTQKFVSTSQQLTFKIF